MLGFSRLFTAKMAEQLVIVFVAAGVPVLVADGNLEKAALLGAVSAGVRAVYGFVVRTIGPVDEPNAK